ncbi:DMT family transporter [Holosporaceae bacterium 'Namur']|nr:DMT family transporter [Holosporaceae bacterium 'Namur']
MQANQHNNIYGILFMILNAAALAILYAVMKLASKDISTNQIIFFYKSLILISILPWIFKNGFKSIATDQIKLHLIRGFLSICGSLSFMYALKYVDLVDATALGYLEQVLLVAIGMLYFKETTTKSKIFCVFASFVGASVILYPDLLKFEEGFIPVFFAKGGFKEFNFFYLFTLLAVACWTMNCIVVKVMGKTEKTKTQLFYVTLFSCIFAYPFAFIEWGTNNLAGLEIWSPNRLITLEEIGLDFDLFKYIAVIALCYFIHNISFFKAFKYAEISTVIPFEYSKIVFIGILQFYMFDKTPETVSYIGYFLIVGSGLILIRSEAKRRKKKKIQQQIEQLNEEYEHA